MSELKGTSKKKTYKKLLGVLILVLIIFAGYYFISSQQGKPKSSFDGFIDKDSILNQQEIVEVERTSKPEVAKRVDLVVRTIPDLDSFKRILEKNNQLESIGVLFEFDSKEIAQSYIPLLDFYVEQYLALGAGYVLLVEGYTCDIGTVDYNLDLSSKRTNSIKTRFLSKGVYSNQLKIENFGESLFVQKNNIKQARIENRRVNISIIDREDL